MIHKCLAVFLFGVFVARAEIRDWRSADGSKNFRGEFVKQTGDNVTIRNESGKELTFPHAKLHADDLQWLKDQSQKAAAEAGVFGGIRFGDTEAQLLEHLKTNPHVIMPNSGKKTATGFGSSDALLDVKTKVKPGGAAASVSFTWVIEKNVSKLYSFDITCAPQDAQNYDGKLRKSLDEMTQLLISIHGNPATTAPFPSRESVKENAISATNSWTFSDHSSLEVGVGLIQNGQYVAASRFSAPVPTAPMEPKHP